MSSPPSADVYSSIELTNHPNSNYKNNGGYQSNSGSQLLSRQDFFAAIGEVKTAIRDLNRNVSEIGRLHQEALSSTARGSSSQLEHHITQTQLLVQRIRGDIRRLEQDAVNSKAITNDSIKEGQIQSQKREFDRQLREYQKNEQNYRRQYQSQMAREYRIVSPNASEAEVQEAIETNWGNEGIFQTALKSNRKGQSSSVLQSVRSRHEDIVRIERTIDELAQVFIALDEQVVAEETMIRNIEQQVETTNDDLEGGNKQLKKSIWHAQNVRKLKWWTLGIVVLIIIIVVAVVLAWCYTVGPCKSNNNSNQSRNQKRKYLT